MCGCSKSASVPFVPNQAPVIDNLDCGVTLQDIIDKQVYLNSLKNSTNLSYINANLGLLQTMINTGKYCLYNIASMSV